MRLVWSLSQLVVDPTVVALCRSLSPSGPEAFYWDSLCEHVPGLHTLSIVGFLLSALLRLTLFLLQLLGLLCQLLHEQCQLADSLILDHRSPFLCFLHGPDAH